MIPFSQEHFASDFPFLAQSEVAYLDNASTTQRPWKVLFAMEEYYKEYNANVHRGIYEISEKASEQFEAARKSVQIYIGAQHQEEIIFTSGTTHSINLAARLLAQDLNSGDVIILSPIEHHANVIPWQLIAKETGAVLKYIPLNADEEIEVTAFQEMITEIGDASKVLAITAMSNVTGYMPPVKELIAVAHEHNMLTVIDGAQAIAHHPVNVVELDADFYAFSGHKICGPTGVGVLYGKRELLERYEPVFGGGSMIDTVEEQSSTWAALPLKFEPGTPNVAGVIGLGAAVEYLKELQSRDPEEVPGIIHEIYLYAVQQFEKELPTVRLLGPKNHNNRTAIISFVIEGIHPHDIAAVLDQEHVAIRVGHHCAQPLMKHWNVAATARASFFVYTTREEIDRLVEGLKKAITLFKPVA